MFVSRIHSKIAKNDVNIFICFFACLDPAVWATTNDNCEYYSHNEKIIYADDLLYWQAI